MRCKLMNDVLHLLGPVQYVMSRGHDGSDGSGSCFQTDNGPHGENEVMIGGTYSTLASVRGETSWPESTYGPDLTHGLPVFKVDVSVKCKTVKYHMFMFTFHGANRDVQNLKLSFFSPQSNHDVH